MTTRQQRRSQERRQERPAEGYSPDFLEGVNILNRLDPMRLKMAVAMLEALESKSAAELVQASASGGLPLVPFV